MKSIEERTHTVIRGWFKNAVVLAFASLFALFSADCLDGYLSNYAIPKSIFLKFNYYTWGLEKQCSLPKCIIIFASDVAEDWYSRRLLFILVFLLLSLCASARATNNESLSRISFATILKIPVRIGQALFLLCMALAIYKIVGLDGHYALFVVNAVQGLFPYAIALTLIFLIARRSQEQKKL